LDAATNFARFNVRSRADYYPAHQVSLSVQSFPSLFEEFGLTVDPHDLGPLGRRDMIQYSIRYMRRRLKN
jgi:hypothetical protein